MFRVYELENFAGRVAYASKVIARGGAHSRAFDTCFEMHDGAEVAAMLIRRAERNPKLAANLFRYIAKDRAMEAAAKLSHVSSRDMAAQARRTREREAAASLRWMEEHSSAGAAPQ